jgi:hypothetical protein
MFNPPRRTSDRNAGASKRNARGRLALGAVAVLTALAGSAPAMATPVPTAPSPIVQPAPTTTQGIIMRDGGICDPIRHMGC